MPVTVLRLIYINWIAYRYGLEELLFGIPWLKPIRYLLLLNPLFWVRRNRAPRAVRVRRAIEDLGPIFVKFGQILSTRRDLLPEDISRELARLQDRVAPFPGETARAIVAESVGRPVEEAFQSFNERPLASASIAQVHEARLLDGREVIVKVVRPQIHRVIRRDLGLLKLAARLAERYWSEGPRLHPQAVVAEFETTLVDELDLMREGANASQLRRNFHDSRLLYIPEVEWPLTTQNVMVMERIYGDSIGDIAALSARGVDFRRLAEAGVEIFFTQVFRDNFFHADMHPGNIFVDDAERYVAVDFGIMGSLTRDDQRYLAENFLAFFNRDYRRVAELHVASRWVPADTRVDQFEAAIRTVCEPIFDRPLKDISFGHLLLRLFQTARRFHMEVQPQLVLLQKTLLNVEGLGRQLYPDLDLWKTAKPHIERWVREQTGPTALWAGLRHNAPTLLERLPEIPNLVYEALDAHRKQTEPPATTEAFVALQQTLIATERRRRWTGGGIALFLGGIALVLIPPPVDWLAPGVTVAVGVLFAVTGAVLTLASAVWRRDMA